MNRKIWQVIVISIGGLLGLLALILFGGKFWISQQAKQMSQDWVKFASQFPKTATNDSARQLNQLTIKLGIGPAVSSQEEPPLPGGQIPDFENIREELDKFLNSQLEQPTSNVQIPAVLQTYLQKHAGEIAAIRRHIASSEPPVWHMDIERFLDISAPLPNLGGLLKLQKIFMVDILVKNRLDKNADLWSIMAVSYQLNQALLNRPDAVSQLLALAVAKLQAGVVRQLNTMPPEALVNMMAVDYQKSLQWSLMLESWMMYGLVKLPPKDEGNMGLQSLELMYLQLSAMDTTAKNRQAFTKLEEENTCTFDKDAFERQRESSIAWWNELARMGMPDWAGQWQNAGKVMLDWELTAQILAAKTAAATTGKWPSELPAQPSKVCPGERWIYQLNGDGTMSISFSRQLPWLQPTTSSLQLPLDYTAPPWQK
ncbi:MAG TPA: hypothetical protein IGS52_20740 [Oscillatoriaceae cyanobacterium M33_DOE_052]|uniref:Uncharacterized protein n=1 Tax=Planktothricoides sp. SpSt-374 TaxID=2282167 RepID=A0A7C3VK11_9CYAN|nr:hypothetical protein [Oscillatoriaceae cyanobacterium M33_DOE_052]